jgi:hypothetical protein
MFLADQAGLDRQAFLLSLAAAAGEGRFISAIQMDEMESFEISKCLPLSIPLVVLPGSRKILGFEVAEMPAKGPLASISLKKYGPRIDDRKEAVSRLLNGLRPVVSPTLQILTDQKPQYSAWIRAQFPQACHDAVKGQRGCGTAQGELKQIGYDPLFALNHTAAMLRANVNRLVRRTWCTTKRPDRLRAHLELYIQHHNRVLTEAAA